MTFRWNTTIMPYLFAWKTIWAFTSLSHQFVQLPAARKHFAGDSVVLLARQEFTNRGGKPRLLRRWAQARSQTRQAETQPAQSGVLLLTSRARTHVKGMQVPVTGQVWRSVDWEANCLRRTMLAHDSAACACVCLKTLTSKLWLSSLVTSLCWKKKKRSCHTPWYSCLGQVFSHSNEETLRKE